MAENVKNQKVKEIARGADEKGRPYIIVRPDPDGDKTVDEVGKELCG